MIVQLIQAVSAVSVPIVVAVVGYKLNRRLKEYDASQWRNQELIKARLQYFGQIAPMLNDLMCYLTFVGRWKELTPPEVIALKRDLDRLFYPVAPLFSTDTETAYNGFMQMCFATHGGWGRDARIQSGFIRRRQAAGEAWRSEWESMFTLGEDQPVEGNSMLAVRAGYDTLVAKFVGDVELLEPRQRYASRDVVNNAW
ncbi:hypothetical protein [Mycobacterium sp. URHD0025]|uniref:hypothetical protein n=1 Tax=Mycobacterium sp. URHD0025 TaxID=1298864 RepID=UPI00041483AE|nr:hypothetical protein [Mycobacterium sp. URHD0025]